MRIGSHAVTSECLPKVRLSSLLINSSIAAGGCRRDALTSPGQSRQTSEKRATVVLVNANGIERNAAATILHRRE